MYARISGLVLYALLAGALAAFSQPVSADGHRGNIAAQTEISADQAAAAASQATGGRVLKVERVGNRFRVRVLTEGEGQRIRTVSVDVFTGRVSD